MGFTFMRDEDAINGKPPKSSHNIVIFEPGGRTERSPSNELISVVVTELKPAAAGNTTNDGEVARTSFPAA